MSKQNNSYQLLDQKSWSRKEHFEFFQNFGQPFFNICCELNAKNLFNYCQHHDNNFFEAYTYLAMKAFNKIEPFRYRLAGDEVRIYDEISISVTQMTDDQSFRFSDIPFADNFCLYQEYAKKANEKAKSENFLSEQVLKNQHNKNTVYMTVIPWISFTSFSHAKQGKDKTGIPRFVFGKMKKSDYAMPISIEVHHSLMDGLDVGELVQILQQFFDQPDEWLGNGR